MLHKVRFTLFWMKWCWSQAVAGAGAGAGACDGVKTINAGADGGTGELNSLDSDLTLSSDLICFV